MQCITFCHLLEDPDMDLGHRMALCMTQVPIQWVPGVRSPLVKQPGCEADPHLHSLWRLRRCGAILPLPMQTTN
jgi:hypothetical protein